MKQYTDFNDLAMKSVAGSEAVERQVQPMVEKPDHAPAAT
jgi:hypothetical protein